MPRSALARAALAAVVLLAACRDPLGTSPAAPAPAAPSLETGVVAVSSAPSLALLVGRRLDGQHPDSDVALRLVSLVNGGAPAQSCGAAVQLVQIVLGKYDKWTLAATPTTPTLAQDVKNIVFLATGTAARMPSSPCPNLTAEPSLASLAPGGGAAFVIAALGGTVLARDGSAEVQIPARALPFDAFVSIAPIATRGALFPTTLPQLGPFVDVTFQPSLLAAPGGTLLQPATVILTPPGATASDLRFTAVANLHAGATMLTSLGGPCPNVINFSTIGIGGIRAAVTDGTSRPPCSSGTNSAFSPYGIVRTVEAGFTPGAQLVLAYVCDTQFRLTNYSTHDIALAYQVISPAGAQVGPTSFVLVPHLTVKDRPGVATLNAPALAGGGVLRTLYGATLFRATRIERPRSCVGLSSAQ